MSIKDLPPADREALMAARQEEYENFWPGPHGRRARYAIEMFPLLHADKPRGRALIPAAKDMRLRRVVETFGKYFKLELGFDVPPFAAEPSSLYESDPTVEVVLFDARKVEATFPIAAGAAGLSVAEGQRWLDWIWIHPFERGRGLGGQAWNDLEDVYGRDFKIQSPLSPAMEKFLTRRGVDRKRWAF
ncbi:hypothetical protein [Streptomyces sp. HUAS TT20]|uniref:hypothetical protein n=1 Tax=Streptomyces sp. HUAS TT20 TaxID=3447509 RepID=UPI0021D8EAC9|nr:hypothetical protein [Streptomyces sp. HUAS 15-9]UXY32385.1 hypothetical protein N8I87_41790 [Streptomyces sp. HUAS 15-9]